jgi:ABC-type phosphate transport system auxiliary subunit
MQDNNEVVFGKQFIKMSRLKQNQIIDTAIQSVASITESQCSLSETDLIVLNEALERLQFLKRKKGKTNEQIRNEIVQVVALLVKFFKD